LGQNTEKPPAEKPYKNLPTKKHDQFGIRVNPTPITIKKLIKTMQFHLPKFKRNPDAKAPIADPRV
jgi:hypothetical protein